MSEYTATVEWQCGGDDFLGNRYSRKHSLRFDGGAELSGSSSPNVVPLPMSDASAVDPEEMFVASLSSCHMLWFCRLQPRENFASIAMLITRLESWPVTPTATPQ